MSSKRQHREKRQFWAVVSIALTVFAIPPILGMWILGPLKKSPNPQYGILRPEVGQAAIISETAASDPAAEPILAVETLNGRLTELVLQNPSLALLLPSKKPEEMEAILSKDLLDEEFETLRSAYLKAQRAGAKWIPQSPPWGTFQFPQDRTPIRGVPYGIIQPKWGAEKSRRNTENTLNRLIFQLGPPSTGTPLELLQTGIEKNLITPNEARETLGLCQLLNIEYQPNKGLFLSTRTLEKWDITIHKINTLSPEIFP